MSMISWFQPAYSVTGFVVGMLVGLTGVGGGSLMTPLLILLFGVHPATAVGTDLLFAATTKTAGTLAHGVKRTVDWGIVRRMAAGSVPTSIMTMLVLRHLDTNSAAATEFVTAVLTLALFVTAVILVFRKSIIARYSAYVGGLGAGRVAALTMCVGCIVGMLVTISSVGAGAIGVTALILLYPKLSTARIVGSDIAHAVPLTFAAGIGHWLLGSTDLRIFASLVLGSVPGILLSGYIAARIPETALRIVLAATLIVVATKLSIGLHNAHLFSLALVGHH
jgi:uncharacterized membrane protein YfcA